MVCALWSLSPNKERNEAHALFAAIRKGDVDGVRNVAEQHPHLLNEARSLRRLTPLHLAASIGQLEVLIALLERGADAEPLDRYGKTPLMLACKQKKWACAEWLLDRAGANIIVFGSSRGRTCLHYAAKGGNSSCVQKILAAADSSTWGLARFLNAQDRSGITALHLASLSGHAAVVQELLSNGALVSARTIPYGQINELGGGMSPLHAAARGGSVECVQALLSWGADRRHRDNEGFTAYGVANEYHNFACAALLNPNAAEPLELAASGSSSIKDEDVCCICFDHLCTIQIKDCGHQMCATCALKLCCHGSSSSSSSPPRALACPFCRQDIASLVLAPSSISHGCRDEQQQEMEGGDAPPPPNSSGLNKGKEVSIRGTLALVSMDRDEEERPPSGWPLGLEPVHLRKRVLDTLVDEDRDPSSNTMRGTAGGAKISTTSYSDETSNLETESSCSSKFFPDDKPVTLGEILGMSLNHLATSSFRSIELHVAEQPSSSRSSTRSWSSPWSLMMRCKCTRASTASSRFEDDIPMPGRIYTNSMFEEDGDQHSDGGHDRDPVSLLDHLRGSALHDIAENPLFLLDYVATRQQRRAR
ncbi:hypothetical protein SELMODRAFT_413088 [Selaginella moellendorffii]|uniref:RING-type E3 ubiquitin transferase n=1 Tax=Selaginella moellendorffii TaxID=88036 RepID=D8RNA7_SELML|nr:hypothetical protein SELMODRAFT_413088 [Selaginella moellendorffii]